MTESERKKIVCPNCDAVIATVPDGRTLNEDGLICSNCGAELRTPSTLERVVDKVKHAVTGTEQSGGSKRS